MEASAAYPVTLDVDYPERQSRWKTLLRLFLVIPVLVFALIVNYAQGAMIWAIWIAVLFRGRIPRWMFDFDVALINWQVRAFSYCLLLTDTYPPFEGDYPVRFDVEYPERLSRWKLLIWKYTTALPHMVVLTFLWVGACFAVAFGWFAILFTGRFPKGLHGYVAGVVRWSMRVQAYVFSLTDEYPPFSLSAEAGPAGRDTHIVSSVIGWLLGVGLIALFVAGSIAALNARETVRVDVSYAGLKAGHATRVVQVWNVDVSLTGATDPAGEQFPVLYPLEGKRFVSFWLELDNERDRWAMVWESDFRLKDSDGKWHGPLLAAVGGRLTPDSFKGNARAVVLFEIDKGANPAELQYRPAFTEGMKRVIYEFE